MTFSLDFSPLVPWSAIAVLALGAVALTAVSALNRLRGTAVRALAMAALVAALAGPAIEREDRESLPGVVALVIDKSTSQSLGRRDAQAEAARAALTARLQGLRNVELRVVEAGGEREGTLADGTELFGPLSQALADVPPERLSGVILLTDGQVHDVPKQAAEIGLAAPLHALLTGREGEVDRRVFVEAAPRFGLVGTDQVVTYRVIDRGPAPSGGRVRVVARRDGEVVAENRVLPGEPVRVPVRIAHGGDNIVEIEAEPVAGELTEINNRAVATIEGIRENLRVLLVSGEPHAGERTWRNLLKSDAAVDLVHFTILRPPEKQDGTPINELSLIAFPTRELFQEKIGEFDLIIFDRYQRRSILPSLYYDNIARYVRDGGALLIASGADFATTTSLFRSPLARVIPAEPTGQILEEPYHARVTEAGGRHPVTRALPGSESDPPGWSQWFRLVDARPSRGDTVMKGPQDKPLLVLAREGKGRVALLLSDHAWLWARSFEGGGPHVPLLRRLSHWLMKEPDLEEESLRLLVRGRDLVVERQTLGDKVGEVTVTTPSGQVQNVALAQAEPGLWRASLRVTELGLWRGSDGERQALVHVGPPNPKEFSEVLSTRERLAPLAEATGGGVRRLVDARGELSVPRPVVLGAATTYSGADWIGLKRSEASILKGVDRLPLFAGFLGLALLLGVLGATWFREGR